MKTDATSHLSDQSELGKSSQYNPHYCPDILFPIARKQKREEIGINPDKLPFYGFDCWNHYEVSWLNAKGKPMVALAEIIYGCESPFIIESKSMKLYFNSFNNTVFASHDCVQDTIQTDLLARVGAPVSVRILMPDDCVMRQTISNFDGICLDEIDATCSVYTVSPNLLLVEDEIVEELVYSDLLKSNCLVTLQPDWGSIQIRYKGHKINHVGLLQYIVSYRNHNEFHEQCIERIFIDIMRCCKPQQLTVYGRYTRRGGVDINPYRSTEQINLIDNNYRLCRQ